MVAVELSTFMQQVIDRVGREPDTIDGSSYIWRYENGEARLTVGSKLADITVELSVDTNSVDPEDSYYHRYELTEFESDNGTGIGTDGSAWTYDNLVKVVGQQVSTSLNLS